jgi:hypothetical protein
LKKSKSEISGRTCTCREAKKPQMPLFYLYIISLILVKKKIGRLCEGILYKNMAQLVIPVKLVPAKAGNRNPKPPQ